MERRKAAVVLAAGKGTRMRSELAKVLHLVCGRPMACFPVRAALEAGASPAVVVVGHQAQAVRERLAAELPGAPLAWAVQERQLGTGHAVQAALSALREAGIKGGDQVLLLAGDVPLLTAATLSRLSAAQAPGTPLAFATVRLDDPQGYGRVLRDADGGVLRVVEEKDATPAERAVREVNASLYAVEAGFLFEAIGALTPANAQGEYYLTDLVALAAARARAGGLRPPVAVEAPAAEVAGVNDREQLAAAAAELRRRALSAWMRAGVTVIDPQAVWIDDGVELEPDVTLEPGVSLRGRTRVAAGAVIGQGSVLQDTSVGPGARVLPYCHTDRAQILAGAIVGPFARLRPEAVVGEEAHVGNFVELKKTTLGKGSKANHLSYLGDAVIGAGVNVGAGTITCNYDGAKKHVTTIEDGAFIGSDTQLVAPVVIGAGAYVGTGTTVREDVPSGALAVSAGKQRNLEGWVAKKAPKKAPK